MSITPTLSDRIARHRTALAVIVGVLLILLGLAGYRMLIASPATRSGIVPQSPAMEDQLGVRFSRVAVVGDGGLILLTYVVLDSEKATRFQSDTTHPPEITSESRDASTHRVSLMKQGHSLRSGQTYYLVYQNTRGALRAGEFATISRGDLRLPHVPVL